MNFTKNLWTSAEVNELKDYLYSIANYDKVEWTKNIVNTKKEVLAIKLPVLRIIAKSIFKGNYRSFMDLKVFDNYELIIINAFIINQIKDFKEQVKYLNEYLKYVDNWSGTDTIKINVENREQEILSLSRKYIKSKKIFVRRMGIILLFKLADYEEYFSDIIDVINELSLESEYYVNMAISWLLCDLFIKQRDNMMIYLRTNTLNKFVINKFISKCRDSYRVCVEDKNMLLNFRR